MELLSPAAVAVLWAVVAVGVLGGLLAVGVLGQTVLRHRHVRVARHLGLREYYGGLVFSH